MANVKEILTAWLKENGKCEAKPDGYEGLHNRALECACTIDELCPCRDGGIQPDCEPGYKSQCWDYGECPEGYRHCIDTLPDSKCMLLPHDYHINEEDDI